MPGWIRVLLIQSTPLYNLSVFVQYQFRSAIFWVKIELHWRVVYNENNVQFYVELISHYSCFAKLFSLYTNVYLPSNERNSKLGQ